MYCPAPGQLVAIVPGFLSITRKTSLVRSLRSMYGDDAAFTIVPRTFKLPDEMDEWEAWINAHPKVWGSVHANMLGGKCTAPVLAHAAPRVGSKG